MRKPDDYARNQRLIRAAQPKRSDEQAHAHARRVAEVSRGRAVTPGFSFTSPQQK